jgi:hypothetical protein
MKLDKKDYICLILLLLCFIHQIICIYFSPYRLDIRINSDGINMILKPIAFILFGYWCFRHGYQRASKNHDQSSN